VLVDEHVLDSYLALAALRPRRAYLLCVPECRPPARRLARVAGERLSIDAALVPVADHSDPAAIAAAYARLPRCAHLHHTGGTGGLAPLIRAAHGAAGCDPSTASGLDEEHRLLRYDDGRAVPLADVVDPHAVTLPVVLALNGFSERPDHGDEERQALTDTAVAAVRWAAVEANAHSILGALTAELERRRPATGFLARESAWRNFIPGAAFEHLVAGLVRAAAPDAEVRVGVHLHRERNRVELDVIAVGHYRPHVISCATTPNGATAKQKLFEVLVRARQVGGLTARPALACLVADDSRISPRELEAMGTTDPSPASRPVVFGAADVLAALRGDDERWRRYTAS